MEPAMPLTSNMGSFAKPVVVVIGSTGTGKSTLCNTLCGTDSQEEHAPFRVSAKADACTFQTTAYSCNWLGDGAEFTIVDTPGMDDPEGRDTEHIAEMVETLKQIKFVNAFIIVFNGQNPRIERSLVSMLKIFQEMFGTNFWKNTIVEISRWSFSSYSKRMRHRQGVTEHDQHTKWNNELRSCFAITHDVPTIFVDACYDPEDNAETEAFKGETTKLWDIINSLPDYECKDFEAVLTEMDQLMADKDEAVRAAMQEEENRKRLEDDAYQELVIRCIAEDNAAKAAEEAEWSRFVAKQLEIEMMMAEEKIEREKIKRAEAMRQVAYERAQIEIAWQEQERIWREAEEYERQRVARQLEAERRRREKAAAEAIAERRRRKKIAAEIEAQRREQERAAAEASAERQRRTRAAAIAAEERRRRERAESDDCVIL